MTKQIQKGFTLIELLVVIAVIGVLAAVVLVAINPLEQIARGQDSNAKNSTASIGNAATAYFTASGAGGSAPFYATCQGGETGTNAMNGCAATLTTSLVASNDLKVAVNSINYCANASGTACGAGSVTTSTVCTAALCPAAVAYAALTSQQSVNNAIAAGAGTTITCLKTTTYIAWSSATGKVGYFCGASAPTAGATVF